MSNPYIRLVATVWQYGAPWKKSILCYTLAFVIAQSCLSLSPYALGKAIDVLQNFEPSRLNEVIFWLLFSVAVILVFWLFHGPGRVVERKTALKIQQAYRLEMYEKLTHLPLKWHQDHHSGNVITRISRASTALLRFTESQFIYIETVVKFLTSIGFLLWISIPVGLISLISSFIVLQAVLLFDRRLVPLYAEENEVENHVGAVLFDYISNMTTVLTLRLGDLTHKNLFQRMMAIWPFFKKEAALNEMKWCTMMLLLSIVQACVLIGYIMHSLHQTGIVMIGLVVMIFRYQWDLSSVFQDLSIHLGEITRMDTDVQSMQPILDDFAKYSHRPQGEKTAESWQTIEIKNLAFHHAPGEGRGQIFDKIDCTIRRGEKIALIGTSGAGKSTLLNLLCGLYTPSKVELTIDGIPFNTLEPLQAITTLIPQDPEIFENTIAFNIALDLSTESSEVKQCIELAGFSKVLETLPQGLKTDIREKGLNFSVGQKQRLALARGLFAARYSSLILMDEPTSSVDLPTERKILAAVIKAFPEAALIISLHRLHLLPKFDTVVMLDKGKVVASGPTHELLHTQGPVRDLWLAYLEEH